jgi:sulfoxide reductase catalytic subunit YedY
LWGSLIFRLSHRSYPNNFVGPHGFPVWVRYCHFFNFLFVTMLIRSGLSILADHPRLYFNNDCTPGSEWIRLTPITVPTDRIWTAKDDARYVSPLVATPGYRHTIGLARCWHFLNVYGFIVTGFFFVIMLFDTEQWRRLVPQSPLVLLQAWNTWVNYATFHLPPELNGFYGYNALQQIAYFSVVFVFGPIGNPHRHSHVAGSSESLSLVRKAFWRQAIGALHSLSHYAQFLCFHRRACDVDRNDRLCS